LIGEQHRGGVEGVGEQQEEVEQRIRTRIGEDPRTADMPRVNVEVNAEPPPLRRPDRLRARLLKRARACARYATLSR
jgi:hypothetical protein